LAPDDVSPFLDEVTAATREGAPLPVRISPGAAPGVLEVFGPPGGEVVLRARGHALRVTFDATPGERDGVVEWDVSPTYRAWIPVALARFLGSPRPETVAVRVRLETWDDVVQDEWWADVA